MKFDFVALEDPSDSEKELVGTCFYTCGVDLNYQQMYLMLRQLFDDNYILCCPFVHRINSMNVIMVIIWPDLFSLFFLVSIY